MKRIGLYAGTFDPITKGHLDVIERAAKQFDELIIAVVDQPTHKKTWLNTSLRMSLIKKACEEANVLNVQVAPFKGLLIKTAHEHNAQVLIRGLRVVSDFEYEQSMAHANKGLDDTIETFFVLCKPEYSFLSSSLIREVVANNGDARQWLPKAVSVELQKRGRINV